MSSDGIDAEQVFSTPCFGYSLDDLIALPGIGACSLDEVNLATKFSRSIPINVPIVSAPMRTVTGAKMAIACALNGGIGVIHSSCTPDEQAREVSLVKRFEYGFIMNPQVLSPGNCVEDLDRLKEKSDCASCLITEGGVMGGKLLGVVTARDTDFLEDRTTKLCDVMTPKARMKVAHEPISLSGAKEQLQKHKVGRLPILNETDELIAMVCRSDLKKNRDYQNAAKDANHQLVVAAAVSAANAFDGDRVRKLVEAGADAIVIDSSHGDTVQQADLIKRMRRDFPTIDIVAGNVATPRQAKPLLDAGADAIRVGVGCSALSSPLEVCAVGRPQGSAVYHVARFVRENYPGVPVIADGGIMTSSQISMALALGASTVMCGTLLAGTTESPGEAYFHGGMRLKTHNGVGCLAYEPPPDTKAARRAGGSLSAASAPPPPSVGCTVVDRGPVSPLLLHLIDGVRRDICRIGVRQVEQLHANLLSGKTRFQVRTGGTLGSMLKGR